MDREEYLSKLASDVNDQPEQQKSIETAQPLSVKHIPTEEMLTSNVDLNALFEHSSRVFDATVTKSYFNKLSSYTVSPIPSEKLPELRWFKIEELIYEKDIFFTDKLSMLYSALHATARCVMLVLRKGEAEAGAFELFIGTGDPVSVFNANVSGDVLSKGLSGFFPGVKAKASPTMPRDMEKLKQSVVAISCVTGVASLRDDKKEKFVQGIEQLINATTDIAKYTVCFVAENVSDGDAQSIQTNLEQLYSGISPMAQLQVTYSKSETNGVNEVLSKTFTDTVGRSAANTVNTNINVGIQHSDSEGRGEASTFGTNVGFNGMGTSMSQTEYTNKQHTDGWSVGVGLSLGLQLSAQTSKAESDGVAQGTHRDQQSGMSQQVTYQNRMIGRYQELIDAEINRIQNSLPFGLWSMATYFLAEDGSTAKALASIYKGCIVGEKSNSQLLSINSWSEKDPQAPLILEYLSKNRHPCFMLPEGIKVSAGSIVSSKELAIHMSLPQSSVPGVHVHEEVTFGREVKIKDMVKQYDSNTIELGNIVHLGDVYPTAVTLKKNELTKHVFVSGSTGSGKSETVYNLLGQLVNDGIKTLVIEPAKGEYRKVFDFDYVFGTNPRISEVLKINPFKFPEGVLVQEHIEHLIEILNVCWPMYAAMPAMLKSAMILAYENCGWDLDKSVNLYADDLFPTFKDLEQALEEVIEDSKYSQEVKSNYSGSLLTRIKSLTNGIYGTIFSGEEIGDTILFNENVIIDLSRIGSSETISLIMGILILRLDESRQNSDIAPNSPLRHVTVLEEAHNILKRCSQEQSMEGANLAGKSVEMITKAIAQMRTYGEGFIIVDQSPGAVDISAIRNTNTKIIMRLPEENDRFTAGKSAAMTDAQVDQLSKLQTGVAAVYQNNWESPVLCKIHLYEHNLVTELPHQKVKTTNCNRLKLEIVKFMCQTKCSHPLPADIAYIKKHITAAPILTSVKTAVLRAVKEYETTGYAQIWKKSEYVEMSKVITNLLGVRSNVAHLCRTCTSFSLLNSELKLLIQRVADIPSELNIAVSQCLMRDYSMSGTKQEDVYAEWYNNMKLKL